MKIKDYIKNKQKPTTPEDAVKMYSKMGEEELMQELFNAGACSKGKVSSDELDSFYSNVQGMLTAEQSEKMRELIIQLKQS